MTQTVDYWKSRCARSEKLCDEYRQLTKHLVATKQRDTDMEILKAKVERLQIAHRDLAKHCGMTGPVYLQYLIDKDLIEEGL